MSELKVTFGESTLASDQLITKAMAQQPIKFYWPKEAGHYYVVYMIDEDAVGSNGQPYLHYRADSVTDKTDGNVMQPYRPPNPPSGVHRYKVVVLDEPSRTMLFDTTFRVAA